MLLSAAPLTCYSHHPHCRRDSCRVSLHNPLSRWRILADCRSIQSCQHRRRSLCRSGLIEIHAKPFTDEHHAPPMQYHYGQNQGIVQYWYPSPQACHEDELVSESKAPQQALSLFQAWIPSRKRRDLAAFGVQRRRWGVFALCVLVHVNPVTPSQSIVEDQTVFEECLNAEGCNTDVV